MAKRMVRRAARVLLALAGCVVLLVAAGWVALAREYAGTPNPAARSMGNDAEWLGHAWVDGRKSQSDVDILAAQLRETGIRDLFVHTGPFNNDGTLDPAIRPKAAWLTKSLHAALPGTRVQAWLGAHPLPDELHLHSEITRAAILVAVDQVLADGFDGIHYDFEPVDDGNDDLIAILRETRVLTRQRNAMLSVSAIHGEPWPGMATCVTLMPGRSALWSSDYLRRVAQEVDQVAVMAYDTTLPTEATYGGYVRRVTEIALASVPLEVTLLIGVPAYHDRHIRHGHGETVAASLRGIRLALGTKPPERTFGVAVYVDFAATAGDWSSYHHDWMSPK